MAGNKAVSNCDSGLFYFDIIEVVWEGAKKERSPCTDLGKENHVGSLNKQGYCKEGTDAKEGN